MNTLTERLAQLDRGEISIHEFSRLHQIEWLAGELLASRFTTLQARLDRPGKCAVCSERGPAGMVRVQLADRTVSLHPHCHKQVYREAAEMALTPHQEARATFDRLMAEHRLQRTEAMWREAGLIREEVTG